MPQTSGFSRAKWFVFQHFERLLVVLLVASLGAIHYFIEHQIAFLAFYYLPIILAGFFLGRSAAVYSAVFAVALAVYYQLFIGLDGPPGLDVQALVTLTPWAGFLILTAHIVGKLAWDRTRQTNALREAYVSMVELLSYHLESTERQQRGHSQRVARLTVGIAEQMGLPTSDIETLRVAALLHEIGLDDPRLTRILGDFRGGTPGAGIGTLQSASALLEECRDYHESIARDWPADRIRVSDAAKILAVADAYETLLTATPNRPAFAPWTALEEIEKGQGQTFGTDVVKALRRVALSSSSTGERHLFPEAPDRRHSGSGPERDSSPHKALVG
jgi:hypothetical protein